MLLIVTFGMYGISLVISILLYVVLISFCPNLKRFSFARSMLMGNVQGHPETFSLLRLISYFLLGLVLYPYCLK